MSKEWIFSDDFKIKFSDKLFNEFMSNDKFVWNDTLVKEAIKYCLDDNAGTLTPFGIEKNIKDFIASKQQSVSKDKLFTTSDGVAVYEGDEFWLLFTAPDSIGNPYKTKARKELLPFRSYQKTFSTEEVSKNWVLMNKPLLSVNDVFKVLGEVLAFPDATLSEIKKLAESKLKQ